MELTVLGRDGSYPGPGGAASGYLVRGGGATLWLDTGPGTLANLQRHVSLFDVDAVVVSHEHPDHRSDLEGFAVACAHVVGRSGVAVYAPSGVREHGYHTDPPTLDWHAVHEGSVVTVSGLRLSFARTDHGPETLAVRVDGDDASLGYSADTGPGWRLSGLGPALDLALVEATFLAADEGGGHGAHLSARQAGTQAREAGAGRLVITHLWPVTDAEAARAEAEAAFGRPVEVAHPGATYGVGLRG